MISLPDWLQEPTNSRPDVNHRNTYHLVIRNSEIGLRYVTVKATTIRLTMQIVFVESHIIKNRVVITRFAVMHTKWTKCMFMIGWILE